MLFVVSGGEVVGFSFVRVRGVFGDVNDKVRAIDVEVEFRLEKMSLEGGGVVGNDIDVPLEFRPIYGSDQFWAIAVF